MRILAITGGAANMYCGSCFRDNALAAELLAQGHEVTLVPFYTPTLTDEANVSQDRIFFGGISIYLQQKSALFRHTPRFMDRLWDSRWALKLAAKSTIPTAPEFLGELTVSTLEGPDGAHAKEVTKLLDWLRTEPRPDVISLPYALLIGLAKPLKDALGSPICLTLQGEDLFLDGLREPYRTRCFDLIRKNLPYIDAFLPVSEYYAGYMRDYLGIPSGRMHVVPLGINLHGYDTDLRLLTNCFTVGYFARVCPEKGLHHLCAAYIWARKNTDFSGTTLEAAGYLAPENKPYLASVKRQMESAGLGHEFAYRGALDRAKKIDFLRNLNVLSVPSDYAEPKGIYLLETLATGVPVVQPRRGAFPEIIEKTGGGLLVEPNDTEALGRAIYSLWRDREQAKELGRRGAQGVREHYSVSKMAARAAEVYGSVALGRVKSAGGSMV